MQCNEIKATAAQQTVPKQTGQLIVLEIAVVNTLLQPLILAMINHDGITIRCSRRTIFFDAFAFVQFRYILTTQNYFSTAR